MKKLRAYAGPACVSVALFVALYHCQRPTFQSEHTAPVLSTKDPQEIELPHGRVLYVIVEENGVYVGDDFIDFSLFESFLQSNGHKLQPDYFMVFGTDLARYGKIVQIYACLRNKLGISGTMQTLSVPVSTRRPAIEVHDHHWEY
jgi:hypothetical protein